MSISILVEPIPAGFRASTGGPLELSAEAESASEALGSIRTKIESRLAGGSVVVQYSIPEPQSPKSLAENPLLDDWLKSVEKYREEKEAEDRAIYG